VTTRMVALGDICSIARGGSPRPIEDYFTESEEGLNWIKIGDVREGDKYIISTKQKIRKEGLGKTRAVRPGDFLLSNSMSFGRPYITKIAGCIHDGWLVLSRDISLVDEDYLYHLLSSPAVYAQFEKFAVGAVVRNLNSDIVRKIVIRLPCLPEQKRIAAILDKADEIRKKRELAITKLDQLATSVFHDLVRSLANCPHQPLAEVSKLKRGPFGGALKKEIFVNHGAMVYEQRNAIYNDCMTARYFITPKKFEEMRDFAVQSDDLIVSCSGTLGKVALVPSTAPVGIINQALLRVRPDKTLISPMFLKFALESREIQSKLLSISHGTGLQNFPPMESVRVLPIPVPPRNVQNEFVGRIETANRLVLKLGYARTKFDELVSSLRSAYLGQLNV
jgi:type I restriction enzyme S subunit